MSLDILGVGTAVPRYFILQEDAARLASSFVDTEGRRERALRALYRRTGVSKRHSVMLEANEGTAHERQTLYPPSTGPDDPGPTTEVRMSRYERDAPDLAIAAARTALEASGLEGRDLTHLVTVSCTGFFSPGVDAAVIEELGLCRTVHRTHVGFMGCHGTLNGLRVAGSFAAARPEARVLVSSVELCSLHYAYGADPDLLVANALFADGAGALVGASDGSSRNGPAPSLHRWRVLDSATLLMPDSAEAMSWRIGAHGFRMTLSARVPDLIRRHLAAWVEEWLGSHDLRVGDVGSWAVHPGGPRIVDAVRDALALENDQVGVSREVLAEYGNMSSATILFILERLRESQARLPCVAMAFGPGLVVEAALIG
jgi:predicted naringenin-chalcone synthase